MRTTSVRRELHRPGLQIPEVSVETAWSTDQFVVRTDLDDTPVDHPDDPVAAANGRQTVGDDDDRAVLDDVAHVALDDPFTLIVERRSRLVEDENARIGRQRPRQRDALTLAAGQVGAALLDHRVVAFAEFVDEFVGAGKTGDFHHPRARHRRIGEGDILVNGAIEQQVLLQHDADMAAQPRGVDLAQVGPIHQNLSFARQVEPLNELAQRRLARAG